MQQRKTARKELHVDPIARGGRLAPANNSLLINGTGKRCHDSEDPTDGPAGDNGPRVHMCSMSACSDICFVRERRSCECVRPA
jgi:hypothetical protein